MQFILSVERTKKPSKTYQPRDGKNCTGSNKKIVIPPYACIFEKILHMFSAEFFSWNPTPFAHSIFSNWVYQGVYKVAKSTLTNFLRCVRNKSSQLHCGMYCFPKKKFCKHLIPPTSILSVAVVVNLSRSALFMLLSRAIGWRVLWVQMAKWGMSCRWQIVNSNFDKVALGNQLSWVNNGFLEWEHLCESDWNPGDLFGVCGTKCAICMHTYLGYVNTKGFKCCNCRSVCQTMFSNHFKLLAESNLDSLFLANLKVCSLLPFPVLPPVSFLVRGSTEVLFLSDSSGFVIALLLILLGRCVMSLSSLSTATPRRTSVNK